MEKIQTNGIQTSYTRSSAARPTKETIVFSHSFPHSSDLWKGQLGAFSEVNTVAYDVRGHGRSGAGEGYFLIETFADDLIAFVEKLGLERPTLCGLSMGGYIALRAVEKRPELFSRLILCDTTADPDDNAAKLKRAEAIRTISEKGYPAFVESFIEGAIAPESERKPGLKDEVKRMMLENEPKNVATALIALTARMDMNDSLKKISIPTLVVVGEKDKPTPVAKAKKLVEGITGAELQVIPGAGHLSCIENPEAFNSALRGFLGRNPIH